MRREYKCRQAAAREAVSAHPVPMILVRQHSLWPEFVSESQSREEGSKQDTRGAHFRCRDSSISFHHALVSTASPRTRVRGLSIGAVFRHLGAGLSHEYADRIARYRLRLPPERAGHQPHELVGGTSLS